ncbi:HEXXH motif domain-containing protein [Nonomuraea sp. NPDC001699]
MSFRRHRISDELFTLMASGGGGAEAMRQLAAIERSKHLLLLRGVVLGARTAGHPGARDAADAYELLAAVQDKAPAAVEAVLCYPSVGAWLRTTVMELERDPARARPDGLAALAAAAAIRARAPLSVEVSTHDGSLVLPSLGVASVAEDRVTVRSTPEGARVGDVVIMPSGDAPGWRGLRRLTASANGHTLELMVDDLDPHRMAADVAGRLPDEELPWWRAALREAWQILTAHHPATADEIRLAYRVVTPLREPERGGQVSGTASETFGAVGVSAPPDGLTLAAALAHEVQHAKLGALQEVVRLTEPDDRSRFYAPWRDDPRPVAALLQGAYAFLGVSGFWRRQRRHQQIALYADAEFARWRDGTSKAVDTLMDSGLLTPAGRRFVTGMGRVLLSWLGEPVPAPAMANARHQAERHLTRWRLANGEPRV